MACVSQTQSHAHILTAAEICVPTQSISLLILTSTRGQWECVCTVEVRKLCFAFIHGIIRVRLNYAVSALSSARTNSGSILTPAQLTEQNSWRSKSETAKGNGGCNGGIWVLFSVLSFHLCCSCVWLIRLVWWCLPQGSSSTRSHRLHPTYTHTG